MVQIIITERTQRYLDIQRIIDPRTLVREMSKLANFVVIMRIKVCYLERCSI